MSEYEDYDEDDSYFTDDNANDYPYFHASYDPFGSIHEDFDSTGITVGNNANTKITWTVPFRFPGQYQDPELEGIIFYNWNRYYSPAIGRYNRADPLDFYIRNLQTFPHFSKYYPIYSYNIYGYAGQNPFMFSDPMGLWDWSDVVTVLQSILDTFLPRGCVTPPVPKPSDAKDYIDGSCGNRNNYCHCVIANECNKQKCSDKCKEGCMDQYTGIGIADEGVCKSDQVPFCVQLGENTSD